MESVTRPRIAGLSLAVLLLGAGACERGTNQADDGGDSIASSPGPQAGESAGEHGAAGHAATGGEALRPIMQRLGGEMTTLTYALMTEDYQTVERSAGAIAQHAPISADELERLHTVLGPDMTRFEAVDESVHVASVRLHDAARERQPGRVIELLGEVQRGCVSCHVQFRERLRTDRGGQ